MNTLLLAVRTYTSSASPSILIRFDLIWFIRFHLIWFDSFRNAEDVGLRTKVLRRYWGRRRRRAGFDCTDLMLTQSWLFSSPAPRPQMALHTQNVCLLFFSPLKGNSQHPKLQLKTYYAYPPNKICNRWCWFVDFTIKRKFSNNTSRRYQRILPSTISRCK